MGLMQTGKRVEIVTDAVMHLKEDEAELTLRDFETAGGAIVTTSQIC
jgi:hypothetical protein